MTPTHSLAETIRADIQTRFGDGRPFSIADFPKYPDLSGNPRRITNLLESLSQHTAGKCGFIRLLGKFNMKIKGWPPVCRYQIATADLTAAYAGVEIPAGSITASHEMVITSNGKRVPNCPHRDGWDGVQFWDRTKSKREWRDGTWWSASGKNLPVVFVMAWWG